MNGFEWLGGEGPEGVVRCPNGHVFEVDACTETNLILVMTPNRPVTRQLVAVCPECGAIDREVTLFD